MKIILRNLIENTLNLTDRFGSNHFAVPSRLAINADNMRGNEVEISEAKFREVASDIYKFSGKSNPENFRYLEIVIRDGKKESISSFDELWPVICGETPHPSRSRAENRAIMQNARWPVTQQSNVPQNPRPEREVFLPVASSDILPPAPPAPPVK